EFPERVSIRSWTTTASTRSRSGWVSQPGKWQFQMVRERPPAAFGDSPPREGETRAKRARGSLTHHLELELSVEFQIPRTAADARRKATYSRNTPRIAAARDAFDRLLRVTKPYPITSKLNTHMLTRSIEFTAVKRTGDTESRSRNTAGLKLPSSSGMRLAG